jgi:hypothetical protein
VPVGIVPTAGRDFRQPGVTPSAPSQYRKKTFSQETVSSVRQELCAWEVCPLTTPRDGLHVEKLLWSPQCSAANLLSSKLVTATSCRRKSSAHGSARTIYMASQVSARPAFSNIACVVLLDPARRRRGSRQSARRGPPQFFDLIFRWRGARDGSGHLGDLAHEHLMERHLAS